ncbi:hypothetical protein MKX03_027335 [Papaver bracteatum]|nr:hypothetical protein MKX03_027335 [Papaver bracteatum]
MENSSSVLLFSKGLKKGVWTEDEDLLLRKYIEKHGEGKWSQVPPGAGLNRYRKSCRLRWLNYLKPNIKRGEFEADEVDLIARMHKLLGNRQVKASVHVENNQVLPRWSLIAGRVPGRTANDVKNFYNTHLKKKCFSKHSQLQKNKQKRRRRPPAHRNIDDNHMTVLTKVLRPQPRTFSKKSQWIASTPIAGMAMNNNFIETTTTALPSVVDNNINHEDHGLTNNSLPSIVNHLDGFSLPSVVDNNINHEHHGLTNNSLLPIINHLKGFSSKNVSSSTDDYYCNFDGDYWNNDLYLDDDIWRMLGENQDGQYLTLIDQDGQ